MNSSISDGMGPLLSPLVNGSGNNLNSVRNMMSPKTVLVPLKYSLSETLSPKDRLHPGVSPVNKSSGPLLTSTSMSINLSTYLDSKSAGLSTRVVQYNNRAQEHRFTHQARYGSPGVLPIVHLRKPDLPTVSITPKKVTVRIVGPELPVAHHKMLEDSPSRRFASNTNATLETDLSTRSVLDALKEISRKRIQTQDIDYHAVNAKKPRINNGDGSAAFSRKPVHQPGFAIDPVAASLTSTNFSILEQTSDVVLKRKSSEDLVRRKKKKTLSVAQTQTDPVPVEIVVGEHQPQEPSSVALSSDGESTPKKVIHKHSDHLESLKKNKLSVLLQSFNKGTGADVNGIKPVSILSPPNKPKHNKHVSFCIPASGTMDANAETVKETPTTTTGTPVMFGNSESAPAVVTTGLTEPPTPAPSPEPQPVSAQNLFPSVAPAPITAQTTTATITTSVVLDLGPTQNAATFTSASITPISVTTGASSPPKIGGFKYDVAASAQNAPISTGAQTVATTTTTTGFTFGVASSFEKPTTTVPNIAAAISNNPISTVAPTVTSSISSSLFSSPSIAFGEPKPTTMSAANTFSTSNQISNVTAPVTAISQIPNGLATPTLATSIFNPNSNKTTPSSQSPFTSAGGFQFAAQSKENAPIPSADCPFTIKSPAFGTTASQVGVASSVPTTIASPISFTTTTTSDNPFGLQAGAAKFSPPSTHAHQFGAATTPATFGTAATTPSNSQFASSIVTAKPVNPFGLSANQFNSTTTAAATLPPFSSNGSNGGASSSPFGGTTTTTTSSTQFRAAFNASTTAPFASPTATSTSGIFAASPLSAAPAFKSAAADKPQFGQSMMFGGAQPSSSVASNPFETNPVTTSSSGGFGSFAHAPEKPTFGSGFGAAPAATPATTPAFGSSTFGNNNNSNVKPAFAFGAPATTSSGFPLAKSPAMGFGSNATVVGNTFGAPTTAAPPPTTTVASPFNPPFSTTTASAFSLPNANVHAAPPNTVIGPGFGAAGDAFSKSAGNVFGSGSGFAASQQTPQQQQQSSSSGFGSFSTPKPNDTFMFGAAAAPSSASTAAAVPSKPGGMFTFGASSSKEPPKQPSFQFNSGAPPAFGAAVAPSFGAAHAPPAIFGSAQPSSEPPAFGATFAANANAPNSSFTSSPSPAFAPSYPANSAPAGMFSIGSGNPKRTQMKARRRT